MYACGDIIINVKIVRSQLAESEVLVMSKEEIKSRIAEIETEEKEIAERQYRYGYIADRQHCARLFLEKMQLMKQLKLRSNCCLKLKQSVWL